MEFEKIPLENIKRRYLHVKKEFVDEFMDDLILSIKTLGLIQPIAICKNSEQEYDVIDGNRRLRACLFLNQNYPDAGFEKVECVIHEKIEHDTQMIHTLIELVTTPVSNPDLIDSMIFLWNYHPHFGMIQKEYGISEKIVKKYLRYQWWPESLKSIMHSGEISSSVNESIDCISRAIYALNWPSNSDVSEDTILELAKELGKSKPIRRIVEKS